MADPFSAAGSAVGVISLGLTVCQGLLAYYAPFKAFYAEIDEVAGRMTALDGILKALLPVVTDVHAVLSPAESSQSAAVAIKSILDCQQGIDKLKRMLEKCDKTESAGGSTKPKSQVNRFLYPFRHDTLMALLGTMSWLQANLDTSLQMLSISMMAVNRKQMDQVIKGSASNASHIVHVASLLEQQSVGLDGRLDSLEQHLEQMEFKFLCRGARPILAPSLLRSILNDRQMFNEDAKCLAASAKSLSGKSRASCTCSRISRGHACPYHDRGDRITWLLKRWNFCNWILSFSIQISLKVTKGAGGYSISPSLHFRATVPMSSPIFSLLFNAQKGLRSEAAGPVIENAQQELLGLLRQEKGSYSDTLANGDTILHVITGWQLYSSQWNAYSWLCWRALTRAILEVGTLADRANDQGKTPADNMIFFFGGGCDEYRDARGRQGTIDICSDLLNAGGFMTDMALDCRHRPTWLDPHYHSNRGDGRMNNHIFEDNSIRLIWQIADEKEVQDIDIPEGLLPLVNKSETHLVSLLRMGIDLQQWIGSYTKWPTGLALLFEFGLTPTYNCVTDACEANSEESIEILVNTGKYYIGPTELQTACNHPNRAIMELVVNALVDHRKRLQSLAETHLPEDVNAELGIKPGTLMSFQAYRACQLLKASFVDIDGVEERNRWSVYDYIGVNLKAADLLWDAGFRDVDEGKKSCLMAMWWNSPPCSLDVFLEKASWLINKGADIHRRHETAPAVQYLGHDIGKLLHSIDDSGDVSLQLHALSQTSQGLMHRILSDDTRDDCCCPCSSAGCSGLTAFLRGLFPAQWSKRDFGELVHRLAMVMGSLASSPDVKGQQRLFNQIAPGVLRFITCRNLNISHTCTHEYYKGIDAEEVKEIQDEERSLILELNNLLAEFLAKLKGSGLSFPDFLTRIWWVHMNDTQPSREPPCEEDIRKFHEAGVILHD